MRGGVITGPRTPKGLERCRRARWKHGAESRAVAGGAVSCVKSGRSLTRCRHPRAPPRDTGAGCDGCSMPRQSRASDLRAGHRPKKAFKGRRCQRGNAYRGGYRQAWRGGGSVPQMRNSRRSVSRLNKRDQRGVTLEPFAVRFGPDGAGGGGAAVVAVVVVAMGPPLGKGGRADRPRSRSSSSRWTCAAAWRRRRWHRPIRL